MMYWYGCSAGAMNSSGGLTKKSTSVYEHYIGTKEEDRYIRRKATEGSTCFF